MKRYSAITIIYNPKSTGNSKAHAQRLRGEVKSMDLPVKLVPTRYAGHARELARLAAEASQRPLIVSSSGDGGYNEVINGVMESGNAKAVCAVLPAGNANDHASTMHSKPLSQLIASHAPITIDLLHVSVKTADGKETGRYAHSYMGIGLTPVVATKVNEGKKGLANEVIVLFQAFMKYRPFRIRHNGRVKRIDSILFANINRMAKVFTLAKHNRPDDGKFEMIIFPAGNKFKLLQMVAKASLANLDNATQRQSYTFSTIRKMPMQLDGEVMLLPAQSHVKVSCAHRALHTISDAL